VPAVSTDGANGLNEIEWINTEWNNQLGYYKKIPELQISIDAKATWTIGKGYKSNEITQLALMEIKGHGKDTFNSILENMVRVYHIGGDAFCEIIRDNDGKLINLKPLNPGNIKIVANKQGIIIRYEQITTHQIFKPNEIFHLSRKRVADEIHGCSLIDAVKDIILMRNEAMHDMKKVMHRHVKPLVKFMLDTDNQAKIDAFMVKCDSALEKGENLYLPMGTITHEIVAIPTNATLNPLPWIDRLNSYFYQSTGVPQIIVGGANNLTESADKISYLAFEQTIEEEQLYNEEQVLAQLNLEIELEFPASLQNEMLSDQSKSETMQAATPEDTASTALTAPSVAP
jgi:hypothetical protein